MNDLVKLLSDSHNEYLRCVRQAEEEELALTSATERLEDLKQAQEIVNETAIVLQAKAHEQIAAVVSRCLEAVFDAPYVFKILFERKRGRTEAKIVFERDGLVLSDPLEEAGHGPIEVAAFAARLACLMLSQPQRRKTIFLDEPFKSIHFENVARVRDLMTLLAKEMEVQFVVVTNLPNLQAGTFVDLS